MVPLLDTEEQALSQRASQIPSKIPLQINNQDLDFSSSSSEDKLTPTNTCQVNAQKQAKKNLETALLGKEFVKQIPKNYKLVKVSPSRPQDQPQQPQYLQSLSQNKFLNKKNVTLTEEESQNKINVNMQVNDFFNFMRLQHEADELKRMHSAFMQKTNVLQMQKKNNQIQFDNQIKQKEQADYKKTKDYVLGQNLARRFLKNGKGKEFNNKAQDLQMQFIKGSKMKALERQGNTISIGQPLSFADHIKRQQEKEEKEEKEETEQQQRDQEKANQDNKNIDL